MSARVMLSATELQPYLKRYSAKYHADVSSNRRHIYHSAPTQRWIKVKAVNGQYCVTFHTDCPCSHED